MTQGMSLTSGVSIGPMLQVPASLLWDLSGSLCTSRNPPQGNVQASGANGRFQSFPSSWLG